MNIKSIILTALIFSTASAHSLNAVSIHHHYIQKESSDFPLLILGVAASALIIVGGTILAGEIHERLKSDTRVFNDCLRTYDAISEHYKEIINTHSSSDEFKLYVTNRPGTYKFVTFKDQLETDQSKIRSATNKLEKRFAGLTKQLTNCPTEHKRSHQELLNKMNDLLIELKEFDPVLDMFIQFIESFPEYRQEAQLKQIENKIDNLWWQNFVHNMRPQYLWYHNSLHVHMYS